ncbi:MAG: sodium:proton antiporter [Cyanobacteria bacterium QS_8_64_29]|nr:MAG: sodium:proton antiporter [Cyanobacteria bacterium QS_8_64_29]
MALENVVGEVAVQQNLKQFLLVLSVSLSVATLSQLLRPFRDIPYTLLLVIVGLGFSLLDVRLIALPPEVTLFVFVPPLLFKTAWDLDWTLLKREWIPIALYAGLGVVVTIACVALALTAFAGVSIHIALLAGASLAATSPAPITALFGKLGVSKRLMVLTEGENLFNSALAVVTFVLLMDLPVELAMTNSLALSAQVLALVGIGLVVGSLLGLTLSYLIPSSDLRFLGRSLLLVAAYGTYLATEELGGSGVVAVITAGAILGSFGTHRLNPQKHQVLTEFLGFVAFLVNSIVFLLIGDQINFTNLGNNLLPIAAAIGAVVVSRALAVYGLGGLSYWLAGSQIDWREQTLLWWTGLRGSVSIALALSVPIVLVQRQAIEATVFGVVLFTLLVQGLTAKPLLEWLGLKGSNPGTPDNYVRVIARSVALNQILNHLHQDDVVKRWELNPKFFRYRELVRQELGKLQGELEGQKQDPPSLEAMADEQLQRELIAMETGIYAAFVRAGFLEQTPPLLVPTILEQGDGSDSAAAAPSQERLAER